MSKIIITKPFRLAICMSGGIDSLTSYYWAIKVLGYKKEDIINIQFDYGQEYYLKEKMALIKNKDMYIKEFQIDIGEMSTWKNYYSPNRNTIFSSIGSKFADEVWIVSNKGDNNKYAIDKNDKFFELATKLNSYATGKETRIRSPFLNLYKHEIIAWGLKNGVNYNNSISCYHGYYVRCGLCADCFSRFINMKYNNIDEIFENNPLESEVCKSVIEEYKQNLKDNDFTKNKKEVIKVTFKVLENLGEI